MSNSIYGASRDSGYFERPAEKLVLDGYRHWTRGTVMGSTDSWTQAQLLYRELLGDRNGEQAIIALAQFVKTLGQCAICPLRVFNSGSHFICRDETLVMGLIAGIQNGDEPTVKLCLEKLCCSNLCDQVAMAAGNFALTLKWMDKMMLPIPAHIIDRIADRPPQSDNASRNTIH